MKTRRFAAVTMGIMVLSVGLLFTAGCGNGDDSAIAQQGASTPTDLSGVSQNWDKNLPAAQRFVVLAAFNSDAVRDNETGLVWERAPQQGEESWFIARETCAEKTVGGRKGWRLPSVVDLSSLVDPSGASSLPPGHPFGTIRSDPYWSATTSAEVAANAWNVFFARPSQVVTNDKKINIKGVWCVRGVMNADTY